MDDISELLLDLLQVLTVFTFLLVVLTYIFSIITGKNRKKKSVAVQTRNTSEQHSVNKRREYKSKYTSSGRRRERSKSLRLNNDFSQRVTSTAEKRAESKRSNEVIINEGSKYEVLRTRARKIKVSPRMEVVYLKYKQAKKSGGVKVIK